MKGLGTFAALMLAAHYTGYHVLDDNGIFWAWVSIIFL